MSDDFTVTSVIIAIDFGTSRTGYSWAYYPSKDKKTYTQENWEHSPVPYCKTLTQSVYNLKTDKFIHWGFAAEKFMSELSKNEISNFTLLKYFKMGLKNKNLKFIEPNSKKEYDVIDIIADYLKALFEKIKKDLFKVLKSTIDVSDIRWCLTIPAVWDDFEKDNMKKAALKAGLINDLNVSEEDFLFVLEPEGAAAYCIEEMKILDILEEDKKILVVDAGGGTVDLTSYCIRKGILEEWTTGSGNKMGSSVLDEFFLISLERSQKIQKRESKSNW
jgi:molecular chaperone DnaK (HSP70)